MLSNAMTITGNAVIPDMVNIIERGNSDKSVTSRWGIKRKPIKSA
jgi:hypothetical protein